ncbi:MAG: FAD:protein FMN transferase [Bacilli bacterium]
MNGETDTGNWVRSSFEAFGSHMELIARPLRKGAGNVDLKALVQAEFAECEQALSRFSPDSELVRLNLSLTKRRPVSQRLWEALAVAVDAYHATDGAIDPRADAARQDLGYQGAAFDVAVGVHGLIRKECVKMWAEDQSVLLYAPVDLGGVDTSYTLERAAAILARYSNDYLLSVDGDIVYAGTGPEDAPWQFGVESPCDAHQLAAELQVAGRGAICTSATDKRHRPDAGARRRPRSVDPATMTPGGGLASVTVLADRPTRAEVLSQVIFLRGLPRRIEAGIKVLMVTVDGDVSEAGGWDDVLVRSGGPLGMGLAVTEWPEWQRPIVSKAQIVGKTQTAGD